MAEAQVRESIPEDLLGGAGLPPETDGVPGDEPITEPVPDENEISAEEQERVQQEENDAREAGWVPQEEWNGDPKRWRSAADYLAVHDRVMPIVQKELRATREELRQLKEERRQEVLARETRTREIERESLKMELRQAREDQNWDKVDEITDKMFDLKIRQPVSQPVQTGPSPEMKEAFNSEAKRNPWLAGPKQDKELSREWARELDNIYKAVGTYDDHADAMRQATNKVRRVFADKFRSRPAGSFGDAGGSNGNTGSVRGRTWNDLKPEFRSAMQDMIDRSIGSDGKAMMTREGILKNCGPEEFMRR